MSDLGKSSNHYRRMRRLAASFDHVLEQLADNNQDESIRQLGEVLIRVSEEECKSYSEVLLLMVACDWLELKASDLSDAGRALVAGDITEKATEVLRRISASLHNESACALSRLRSRG